MHLFDNNDDGDNDFSIRNGDDRKKPALTRPSNKRKRPKFHHDDPTSSSDEPPAKRTRFQTTNVSERRRFTRQCACVILANHKISFKQAETPKPPKTKLTKPSNATRALKQDLTSQSSIGSTMTNEPRNSDHDPYRYQSLPGVLNLGHVGPRRISRDTSTPLLQYTIHATPDSLSTAFFRTHLTYSCVALVSDSTDSASPTLAAHTNKRYRL